MKCHSDGCDNGCVRMKKRMAPLAGGLACILMMGAPLAAQRPERPTLTVSGYVIYAEIDTATHHLTAKVVVSFTAPENADPQNTESVSFGLHPCSM